MKTLNYIIGLTIITAAACTNNNEVADAYGNFQAVEINVSPEVSGKLLFKGFDEGSELVTSNAVAFIDTTQLSLQKQELIAQKRAILSKKVSTKAQMDVLSQQKKVAEKDQERIKNMLKDGAATQKQWDDISGNIDVLNKQILSVQTNYQSIDAEIAAISTREDKLNDLITRSTIYPPTNGLVLQSYAEVGELVAPGRPLFKMADVSTMELKAYVSGDQLSAIKIGQEVVVKIDIVNGELREYAGKLSWVSGEAEFTPKNIQTKKERVSQVYAIKIVVENDGALKINMPAEVYF
jgi:HlyD family secretion protein